MGDIADMILDGILDEQTGEYIGDAVGYPRTGQEGFYNSMSKKPKRNVKHAMKGQSVGGLHLVGKTVSIVDYEDCVIADYIGKRGNSKYVLIDQQGNKHKVKFSSLIFTNK